MKKHHILLLMPVLTLLTACSTVSRPAVPAVSAAVRRTEPLDAGWRFFKGDAPGAEQPAFDDTGWRLLDVPHDWSIEGPFAQNAATRGAGGFLPSGIGWYRKQLVLPADYAARRVFVEFDGVMANSEVWINGVSLGTRPFGYASFRYELTGHLKSGGGAANVLAVRADTSKQPASRWYSGAGIYRHVRLIATDPVHLDSWATFVTTPRVAADAAVVRVQSVVRNQSATDREVALQVSLVDPSGRVVQTAEAPARNVAAGQTADFQQEFTVPTPRRWDIADPQLYTAVARVRAGGVTLDDEAVPFGIRDAHFEAATGFWLNGRNMKLKGVCLHHDAGALGAAVPSSAWVRRLALLKEYGVNAIRTSHNPVAPEFLDACDRLGLLVMDEMFDCWTVAKNPYDYHLFFKEWSAIDVRDTVRRDRNHPSVVLYSAGNEIHDTQNAVLANGILRGLVQAFHENDPTRPVTQALFRPNQSRDFTNGLADLLDVVGVNYRDNELVAAHKAKPGWKIIGTEQRHDLQTWLTMRDYPAHAGQFLWTGIDYLGESRQWPSIGKDSGLFDRALTPKPLAYQRRSWWSDRPMVHAVRRTGQERAQVGDPGYEPFAPGMGARTQQTLFDDWTPAKAAAHDETVEVYSNCERVELFLNGQSLGAKPRNADDSPVTWKIAYAAGTLRAVGTNGGVVAATHELRTAGAAARIVLEADRAALAPGWDEVCYVSATVVDAQGVPVPGAKDLVTFKVAGPGAVAAVDNGDIASIEAFQATERHAYQGRCIAIVRATASTARIVLTATAPGLADGTVVIDVAASGALN